MEVTNEIIKWKEKINEEGVGALADADSNLLNNSEFMISMAKENIDCLQYLGDDLQTEEFFLTLMEETKDIDPDAKALFYSKTGKIDLNRQFFLQAIPINYNVLGYGNFSLVNDKTFMLKAVKIDVRALEYASYTLVNNYEFMLDAIDINEKAVCYLGKTLQTTKFMTFAANTNGNCMRHAKRKFRGNIEVMGYAVKSEPDSLQSGTRKIRNTWEIVRLGLEREEIYEIPYNERNCFGYAGRKIQSNLRYVDFAIRLNPFAYRHVSPKVQGLEDIKELACRRYRQLVGGIGLSDEKILRAIRHNTILRQLDNGEDQKKPKGNTGFVPKVRIIQMPRDEGGYHDKQPGDHDHDEH